jgi:hypothetical protein
VWNGQTPSANLILYGVIGEENPNRPGTYRFTSSMGHLVNDAQCLSPDLDAQGNGEITRPTPGTPCVALMTADGAACYICGFAKPPEFDEDGDDDPVIGNPDDNSTSGDKVFKTAGGASFILKRGGAVIVEGGPGTGVIMNPVNNQMSLRSSNFRQTVDGYLVRRGRTDPGETSPNTTHDEEWLHQVGPSFDRVRVSHGDLDSNARRKFTLGAVTVISSKESVTLKTRETYFANGSWVGEGPKYQWGGSGADEPIVLGNALVDAMNELMDIISKLTVNTAWGPSTPPLPATQQGLSTLKQKLGGNILSTYLFSTKDPAKLV